MSIQGICPECGLDLTGCYSLHPEFSDGELFTVSYAGWNGLLWNCLPDDKELAECEYSETNPTVYPLILKK